MGAASSSQALQNKIVPSNRTAALNSVASTPVSPSLASARHTSRVHQHATAFADARGSAQGSKSEICLSDFVRPPSVSGGNGSAVADDLVREFSTMSPCGDKFPSPTRGNQSTSRKQWESITSLDVGQSPGAARRNLFTDDENTSHQQGTNRAGWVAQSGRSSLVSGIAFTTAELPTTEVVNFNATTPLPHYPHHGGNVPPAPSSLQALNSNALAQAAVGSKAAPSAHDIFARDDVSPKSGRRSVASTQRGMLGGKTLGVLDGSLRSEMSELLLE